jgi:hypothetical protein
MDFGIQKKSHTNCAGGILLASTNCGMLVHVLIQCDSSCRFSVASIARPVTIGDSRERVAKATEQNEVYNIATNNELAIDVDEDDAMWL